MAPNRCACTYGFTGPQCERGNGIQNHLHEGILAAKAVIDLYSRWVCVSNA